MLTATQVFDLLEDPKGLAKPAQVGVDVTIDAVNLIRFGGEILLNETVFKNNHLEQVVPLDGKFYLSSGPYSITLDQGIRLPSTNSALIIHRSSVLRMATQITSGLYDPGFEVDQMGCVMIVHRPIVIEQHARVAQVIVFENEEAELYNGQYQKEKDVK